MMDNENLTVSAEPNAKEFLAKWLRFLFLTQIASVAMTVLASFDFLRVITQIVSMALSVCVVVAMFQLSAVNERYRKAFLFGVIQLVGALGNLFMQNSIFSLASSIGSFVAMYQQYHAHSEVTAELDPELSLKWRSLFIWQLVIGLVLSLAMTGAVMIGVGAGTAASTIVSVVLLVTIIPSTAMEVWYLIYLKRTMSLFETKEV